MDTGKPVNEVRPNSQEQQPKAKVTTQAFQGGQGLTNAKFFRNELSKHHPDQRLGLSTSNTPSHSGISIKNAFPILGKNGDT